MAGGGIGGLTAAVALHRAGLEVQVFERAAEIREVGAGIAIQPNAVLALRRIGLDPAVAEAGCVEEKLHLWTADGTLLACLRPRDIEPDVPFLSLHRATLQRVLLQALGRGGPHLAASAQATDGGNRPPRRPSRLDRPVAERPALPAPRPAGGLDPGRVPSPSNAAPLPVRL